MPVSWLKGWGYVLWVLIQQEQLLLMERFILFAVCMSIDGERDCGRIEKDGKDRRQGKQSEKRTIAGQLEYIIEKYLERGAEEGSTQMIWSAPDFLHSPRSSKKGKK